VGLPNFFSPKNFLPKEKGNDTNREDVEDTTILVQIEEVNRVIRALPFVTKLWPVDTHKDKTDGWGDTLTLSGVERGKRHQFNSRVRKTELTCL